MGAISEKELFAYIKKNQEAAQQLYHALAGTTADSSEDIEVRENKGAYFLVKKGGAMFAFEKK